MNYKPVIKAHTDALVWLQAHNENGHHNRSIERRQREISRLEKEAKEVP